MPTSKRTKKSPLISIPAPISTDVKHQTEEVPVTWKRPTSIRLCGRTIPIAYEKESPEFKTAGEWWEEKLKIKVKTGQIEIEEVDATLHESIHAISYLFDLNLSERQVRLLATGLVNIFQDSPEFASYVTKSIGKTNT